MNWTNLFRKIEKKYPVLKVHRAYTGDIIYFSVPDVTHILISRITTLNNKMVITVVPDLVLHKNEIISCTVKKSPTSSLLDYTFYDKDSYKAICKHLDRILLKRKELLIQKRMNEMSNDF